MALLDGEIVVVAPRSERRTARTKAMRAQVGTVSNATTMLSKFPIPLFHCLDSTFNGKNDLFIDLRL